MSKRNTAASAGPKTHEGAPAVGGDAMTQLKRTVLACLLWEGTFYEDGQSVADRIKGLVPQCNPQEVASLAIEVREQMHLRHVPLLLIRELARYPSRFSVGWLLRRVVQRADELAEFLALYWDKRDPKSGRRKPGQYPLAAQVKKGLGWALAKFDEYQLAKYKAEGKVVSLADVIKLVRPKPRDEAQAALWKRVLDGKLAPAGTHEERMSAGEDAKTVFEDLLRSGKLGHMALLRNLRKMDEVGAAEALVMGGLLVGAAKSKALPFRYISAARAVPRWEPQIDQAMQLAMKNLPKLPGKTVVLVDVSGSMDDHMSGKSDLTRKDAGAALAVLVVGIAESVRVFTFSDNPSEIPAREGMALVDLVHKARSGGTNLGEAIRHVAAKVPDADRLIVFTDEQSHDSVGAPHCKGYMVNVATAQHGVGFGPWVRIDGFSEAIVRYIAELEGIHSQAPETDAESE